MACGRERLRAHHVRWKDLLVAFSMEVQCEVDKSPKQPRPVAAQQREHRSADACRALRIVDAELLSGLPMGTKRAASVIRLVVADGLRTTLSSSVVPTGASGDGRFGIRSSMSSSRAASSRSADSSSVIPPRSARAASMVRSSGDPPAALICLAVDRLSARLASSRCRWERWASRAAQAGVRPASRPSSPAAPQRRQIGQQKASIDHGREVTPGYRQNEWPSG